MAVEGRRQGEQGMGITGGRGMGKNDDEADPLYMGPRWIGREAGSKMEINK